MKRGLFTLLIGATLMTAADVEAQRGRNRDRGNEVNRDRNRVERLEPVRARGRVVPRVHRASRPAQAGRPSHRFNRGSRVVYSTRARYPSYTRGHRWARVDWGRVRLRTVFVTHDRGYLNKRDLRDLLGKRTVDRIKNAGRRAGLRGSMRGFWVAQRGYGEVLVVTMGGVDVAELADFNRDGFIDEVFLVGPSGRWMTYGW